MSLSPFADFALSYAQAGYKVFPCMPGEKRPHPQLSPHGLKDATTDPELITLWAEACPDANIGLVTGEGMFVLDVDYKGLAQGLTPDDWERFKAIDTFTVYTPGGGFHKYLRASTPIRNTVNLCGLPGVDIRGVGGYVVAGGSIGYNPVLSGIRAEDLSYPPPWLTQLVQAPALKLEAAPRNEGGLVPVGGRNHYLTSVAGALQRKGLSYEALEAALLAENESKLEEPLEEREVLAIAKSVARYAPSDPISFADAQSSAKAVTIAPDQEQDGGALVRASDLSEKAFLYLADKDKVKGTPTMIEGLDKMLGGGKRLGEVTCWHAEAKTGKNTLWHYMMYTQLELGTPIAYASRELSPEEEVIPNLMSVAFRENAWLSEMNEERVAKYQAKLSKWPLYFSNGYGYFAPGDIKAWVTAGVEAGITHFYFDHLHYMLEDPEDHKAASKLIKDLKALAKTAKIHIDIIIQPNKLQDGQRLSLNSIKGGAAMGQAIDNLLILERVKGTPNVSKLTLEVARSKLCKPGAIYLQFDPETCMFGETEPLPDEAPKYGESPMGEMFQGHAGGGRGYGDYASDNGGPIYKRLI